ncbi:MAG: hypothetical protein ACR2MG_20755 [Pyrinomonadaceae bacterium]
MLDNRKTPLLIILLFIILSLPFILVLQGQTSKETSDTKLKSKQLENTTPDIRADYPSVEYSSEISMDAVRKGKSEKYNKVLVEVLNPNVNKNDVVVSYLNWAIDLPPLPVEKSNLVLIGKIVQAQAYLSDNKTSVYSEFKIEVEKVLKNNKKKDFEEDKYINVEREGGIVRFLSGYETFYFVSGQRMPKVNHRYVLFLTHEFPLLGYQKRDFYLLTAYELREGNVFPLDEPGGGTHPIATLYKGKKETVLLNNLQDVINNSINNLPK